MDAQSHMRKRDATPNIIGWGDSAFANIEGVKSQAGTYVCLANNLDCIDTGDFRKTLPLLWCSATIKRVVRATLAAEAYASTDTMESCHWLRQVLTEVLEPPRGREPIPLKLVEEIAQKRQPIIVLSDANNLTQTVAKDAGIVADKRLRIVISMLREYVVPAQNTSLRWVPTGRMVADALTKRMDGAALRTAASAGVLRFS